MNFSRFNSSRCLHNLLLVPYLMLLGLSLSAQTISGTVYDACRSVPIAGAELSISYHPPGGAPVTDVFHADQNGFWNYSFFHGAPDVLYTIRVLGGASSPSQYFYHLSDGDQSGLDFNLLPKNWDITINGEEIFWQNNPQSPLTLCQNQNNCLQLTGLNGAPFEPMINHCFQVRLFATDDSGAAGELLASSLCQNFTRPSFSDPCGDQAFDLNELLRSITALPPLIRLEVWHYCCNRECQPNENDLLNKEVVFVEVLDEVQLGFQFTAGDYIDEINAPPTDDGLVPGSTQLPGPFLGAATIGLNIGAFSDDGNVLSWQYTIEEVDCNTGASLVTLFVSPVDDDGGPLPENETFIDKLIGPPGQEVQGYFPLGTGLIPGVNYTAGKCYKVTLSTTTVCGGQDVFSYFQIQQVQEDGVTPCTFCIIAPPNSGTLSPATRESALSISPNPSGGRATLTVASVEEAYSELAVYDLKGQAVLPVFKGMLEKGKRDMILDLSPFPRGIYVLKGQIGGKPIVEKIIVQ